MEKSSYPYHAQSHNTWTCEQKPVAAAHTLDLELEPTQLLTMHRYTRFAQPLLFAVLPRSLALVYWDFYFLIREIQIILCGNSNWRNAHAFGWNWRKKGNSIEIHTICPFIADLQSLRLFARVQFVLTSAHFVSVVNSKQFLRKRSSLSGPFRHWEMVCEWHLMNQVI